MSGNTSMARVPNNTPDTSARRGIIPGRTTYVSENYETETTFSASAPPNSKYAAALQQICADIQNKEAKGYKRGEKREGSEDSFSKPSLAVTRSGELVRTMRRNSNTQVTTQPSKPSPMRLPGQVRRYQNETEVAYQSKGRKGRMWVSAPKGSIEAEQYDAMAEQATQVYSTSTPARCNTC